jgi:hypothetical protein
MISVAFSGPRSFDRQTTEFSIRGRVPGSPLLAKMAERIDRESSCASQGFSFPLNARTDAMFPIYFSMLPKKHGKVNTKICVR